LATGKIQTFLAEAGGERSVVRIFASRRHSPHAAEIQEAVLRLVRGLVPVPAVEEVRRADPEAGQPGLLVTEHLGGVRADLVLAHLGTLLRFDREPAYAHAVLGGYTELRGGDPAAALDTARSADLVALVDLAAR
jgi:hypothetical protein